MGPQKLWVAGSSALAAACCHSSSSRLGLAASSSTSLGCIWQALSHAAGWQVRLSSSSAAAAAATTAAAPAPAPAASSNVSSSSSQAQQQKQQQQQQQLSKRQLEEAAKRAAQAEEQQQQQEAQLQELRASYQRSRMQDFYQHHLARELLLKLNVKSVRQLPIVKSIDLAISAKDLLGRRYAEKWEMLLPALGLEYISGQPAEFIQSSLKYYRSRNVITAVKVRLTGGAALDLLQKLTYLVLPAQNGFEGVNAKSLDRAGNLHFRIPKMINFPDFEEQFEIFENLGAMHVSINMGSVSRHRARSVLLMSGLHLPMYDKKAMAAAAAAAAAEDALLAAATSSDEDDDGAYRADASSSDEE